MLQVLLSNLYHASILDLIELALLPTVIIIRWIYQRVFLKCTTLFADGEAAKLRASCNSYNESKARDLDGAERSLDADAARGNELPAYMV